MKMWRSVLSYFLVAIAISCGKHNSQLGVQSRKKTALKIAVAEKNAAEQSSNRSKKKKKRKSKNQPRHTYWDMWIGFCRFLFPILLLESLLQGEASTADTPMSCKLFNPWDATSGYERFGNERTFTIPFTLPANGSLNNSDEEYPKHIWKNACHLSANRDIDITSSAYDTLSCNIYLIMVRNLYSNTINITLRKRNKLWDLHFERVKLGYYVYREPNNRHKVSRSYGRRLPHYPHVTLVEKVDGQRYFHTWSEDREDRSSFFRDLKEGNIWEGVGRRVHYYSPQSKLREIKEKYKNNTSRYIEELQKQGVAILSNRNLEGYCDDNINLAMHLVSVGAEFLYLADFEKAGQNSSEFLKKWLQASEKS